MNICCKAVSLLLNMLSRLVITFLPRSKRLLISWLQSPSAVILEGPPPNKVYDCFHSFSIYLPWSDGTRCHDLSFLNVEFKPTFLLSSFTFIKKLFSFSSLSSIRVVSSAYLRLLMLSIHIFLYLNCGSDGRESVCNAGDPGSVSGLGRSPGEGNRNPL